MLDVRQLRFALILFDISSSERACQRSLFVKDILTHFSSLPDPWTPADPLPPTCGRPWRVEVEAMLTLRRPLVASGLPRHHAWALQTPLAPMLGTQALVVVRVPSSHSDATITAAVAREPSRENLLKGSLTAAGNLCAPPRAGGTELHHKWGSSDGHFRAIWSQQSGFGQTDDRPAHPTARHC